MPVKLRRGSVLKKYLITYVGIAVAACAALGLLLIGMSAADLKRQEEEAVRARMLSATEDLSYQIELMRNLSVTLKAKSAYQPQVLKVNSYYETLMLKDFGLYVGLSPIVKDYYLWYEDTDSVYTPISKMDFSLFARMLSVDEADLREKLRAAGGMVEIACPGNTVAVCAWPIQFTTYSRSVRAKLFFFLDREAMRARYSGLFRLNDLALRAGGVLLLGREEAPAGITVSERTSGIQIVFSAENPAGGPRFSQRMLLGVLALALLLSFFSALIAYRNYLPIRRLAARVKNKDSDTQNELALINEAIDTVVQQKQASMEALTASLEKLSGMRMLLRQQLLLLVISGEYDPALVPRLAEEGIDLNEGKFVMAHLSPPDISQDALLRQTENLTDADAAFLLTRLPGQRGYAMLIRADNAAALETACDIAADEFALSLPQVQLSFGPVCDSPKRLAYSLAVAESGRDETQKNEKANDEELSRLVRLITAGEEQEARLALDALLRRMQADYPSELFRRYRMTETLYQLVRAGRAAGLEVSDAWVSSTLSTADWSLFNEAVTEMVLRACRSAREREQRMAPASHRLMDYIRAHAFEPDLCLDRVSEEEGIKAKQVSRIVREISGLGFREYITDLRMARAAELLAAGKSSIETAAAVGFTDVSYFTKVFRSTMGCTPGQYKQNAQGFAFQSVEEGEA